MRDKNSHTQSQKASPFEDVKFQEAVRQVLTVSKAEADRRIAECEQRRENKKRQGLKHRHYAPRMKST